jgi:GNAT superfamily N-acetyltransferase
MGNPTYQVVAADDARFDTAVDLLVRFFVEEGFGRDRSHIATNCRHMVADPFHWIGLVWGEGGGIGVVTVTSMLYIEWGRLGEIGDLYVLPEMRRRGIGAALIKAAERRCRALGCSAVSVTITQEGEARHGLARFYELCGS